jgi:hypothetical protein
MAGLLLPDGVTVVLDANVLRADPRLNSPHGQAFRYQVRELRVQMAVPEVALEEAVNRYRRDLENAAQELRRASRTIERMGIACAADVDVATEVQRYEQGIRATLDELRAEILPYPTTPHSDLARRAMERRRPFSDDGRGYRDALVWETVLSYARHNAPIVLISADADFARSKKSSQFHSDFLDDLTRVGISPESVTLQPSIAEFLGVYVEGVDRVRSTIERLAHGETLMSSTVYESINEAILYRELTELPTGAPQAAMQSTVSGLEDVSILTVESLRPAGDGQWDVTMTAIGAVMVEYQLWAADAFTELPESKHTRLQWVNERVVEYEETVTAGIRFSGIWSEPAANLANLYVDSMTGPDGEELL